MTQGSLYPVVNFPGLIIAGGRAQEPPGDIWLC